MVQVYYEEAERSLQGKGPKDEVVGNSSGTAHVKDPLGHEGMTVEIESTLEGMSQKMVEASGFVFLIGGIMLSCHKSVMSKRVLCGDNNSRVVGDFGRYRGRGRKSGKSRGIEKQHGVNIIAVKVQIGWLWTWPGGGRESERSRDGSELPNGMSCYML
nr:hypothetical protein [Tanacetum cinerariifolium]